jgi:hypothetical protein
VWGTILAFRDSPAGTDLRHEILRELATNAGGEFAASVNAGLRRIVPSAGMDSARDELTELMFRRSRESAVVPAVWTNVRNSDAIARLWWARSRKELEDTAKYSASGRETRIPVVQARSSETAVPRRGGSVHAQRPVVALSTPNGQKFQSPCRLVRLEQ